MKKIHIIHGWTYSLDAWTSCLAALRANGFEPVMHRVPGLTFPSGEVWNLDKYVAWIEAELKNEKDIVLAGHSNGGRIAIAYAAKNPLELRKLILIDSAGIVHKEILLQAKRRIFGILAQLGKPLSAIPGVRKIYYGLIGARDYEKAPFNMRETMKNLLPVDLTDRLEKISIPTFIIWGAKDKATPVSDAYLMHEKILNSELFIISDAGHSPHKTHPALLAEKISAFASSPSASA